MAFDVFGIIAPHPPIMVREVGGDRADVTEESLRAMRHAAEALASFAPDTLVVMSPHAPAVRDAFAVETGPLVAGSLAGFGAASVRIESTVDGELASAIMEIADAHGVPAVSRDASPALQPGELDHGVLVPMSFLDPSGRYPLVVLSLSYLPLADHRELGRAVREAAKRLDRRIAFLASGDCSHRLTPDAPAGFAPRAKEFDAQLVGALERGDLNAMQDIDEDLAVEAGECGLRSFVTLAGAIPGAATRLLSYEGPWGVGYMTGLAAAPQTLEAVESAVTASTGRKGGSPDAEEGVLPSLAREAIETYIVNGEVLEPEGWEDPLLSKAAGVFVSLHLDGNLRGCIGTTCPTQPDIAHEVVRNALEAATGDPRFPPVTPEEVGRLDIKVDVLHTAEACALGDLDPSTYGVIVTCGWRRGLLLPDLEGVETVGDQLEIARRKAGIAPGEKVVIERFKVDRHE